MQKINESQLLEKVRGLREYLVVAEADQQTYTVNGKPATKAQYDAQMGGMKTMGGAQGMLNNLTGEAPAPGTGQKGPTVAAAQGKDPSNPLNQAPAPTAGQADVRKVDNAIAAAGTTGAGGGRGGQGGPTAAQLATAGGASAQAKWPTTPDEIKAFQKANGLTADGLIGANTYKALVGKGLKAPAGFTVVAHKAPAAKPATATAAAPAAGASAQAVPAATGSFDSFGNQVAAGSDAAKSADPTGQVAQAQAVASGAQDDATGVDAAVAANAAKPAGASAQAAPAKPATPNPYQGADAQKFASLSPEDQAWLTKGGGKPDINDPFIMGRAPNKGKPAAGASAQAAAPQRTAAEIQASKDLGNFAGESVGYSEDKMLARIIELSRR